MKYQTLTSALVLTFLLAGASAQAMDMLDDASGTTPPIHASVDTAGLDEAHPGTSAGVPPITEEEALTLSTLNPSHMPLIQQILGGYKKGATTEDQENAAKAAHALQQEITERKNAKNAQEIQEQETILKRLFSWLTKPSQQTPLPPQEILNTVVAVETSPQGVVPPTIAALLQKDEQTTETLIEPAPFYFSKLNPWNWWSGSAPTADNVVAEFVSLEPGNGSVVGPQAPSEVK